VIVYAALISVMPRSAGDYVWQSRILGGAVGSSSRSQAGGFILWLWVPLYGDMFRHIVLVPILGVLGAKDIALGLLAHRMVHSLPRCLHLSFVSIFHYTWHESLCAHTKICILWRHVGVVDCHRMLLTGSPRNFQPDWNRMPLPCLARRPVCMMPRSSLDGCRRYLAIQRWLIGCSVPCNS